MRRPIDVSTDVYAAIWAARRAGEDDEDSILARVLGCKGSERAQSQAHHAARYAPGAGVFDARNNVRFAEGFEIFRKYKGRRYEAVAKGGVWLRKDTGATYATINQLNSSIAAGAENVWNGNWKFNDASGVERSIDTLRS
jgi:hypothetical protein